MQLDHHLARMSPAPTSEVLNRAADLIEERGWHHGSGWIRPETPEGAPVCLEGGIQAALGLRFDVNDDELYEAFRSCPAYQAVSQYLDRFSLYQWNDEKGTASEVIETLRACAIIEASRERAAVSA